MDRIMRARPSASMAVALIALFVSLSGVALATHPGGQNTINSADIIDGQVKEPDVGQAAVASNEVKNDSILPGDVAPNSLTSGRIADGSLTGADVANNSLKGADVDEDTLVGGPTNPTGPAGGDLTGTYPDPGIAADAVGAAEIAGGAVGSSELATITVVQNSISIPPGGGVGGQFAFCPTEDSVAISGGAGFEFASGDLSASEPSGSDAWFAEGQNNGTVAQDLHVEAVCLAP
jgi:hypothetical protein